MIADTTYLFKVSKPESMILALEEKRKVLRYMRENWSSRDWHNFMLAPDRLKPHDMWVAQLLRYESMNN